jgi:hypothetical protein
MVESQKIKNKSKFIQFALEVAILEYSFLKYSQRILGVRYLFCTNHGVMLRYIFIFKNKISFPKKRYKNLSQKSLLPRVEAYDVQELVWLTQSHGKQHLAA